MSSVKAIALALPVLERSEGRPRCHHRREATDQLTCHVHLPRPCESRTQGRIVAITFNAVSSRDTHSFHDGHASFHAPPESDDLFAFSLEPKSDILFRNRQAFLDPILPDPKRLHTTNRPSILLPSISLFPHTSSISLSQHASNHHRSSCPRHAHDPLALGARPACPRDGTQSRSVCSCGGNQSSTT